MTHFLQRTALIALATGALGACSTDEALKPSYPTRLPEAGPPPAAPAPPPAAAQPAPQPAPSDVPLTAAPAAPVEQHALAPLPPARPAATSPASPPPAREPIATYRSVTTRSVTGRVIEVEGREVTYRVKKGDTLEDIADKLGTTVSELREGNGLKKRAILHPGQVLKGPRSRGRAYVAESGDTLYSIARRFGVTAEALRDENDMSRDASLHPGEKIRLPEGYRDHGPLVSEKRVRVTMTAAAAPQDNVPEAEPPTPEDEEPAAAPSPASAQRATAPIYRTVTTRSVTGRVVEVEGPPAKYKVRRGDSLEKIARKLDTTVAQLREDNDLSRHERIQPGDTLDGPRTTAHAYVAGAGDTLYSIGRRFGVTAEALRDENDLARSSSVRAGQKIRLPEGYRDRGPLTSTSRILVSAPPPPPPPPQEARQTPVPAPAAAPRPYTPPPVAYTPPSYTPPAAAPPARGYAPPPRTYMPPPAMARSSTPPPPATAAGTAPILPATAGDVRISELGRGRFVWPLQGAIVSDFGPRETGQRNDGINIRAEVGAPVRAAAAGDVVYAGDQVPGFGNLVLIKHADGWVTAYGHLSRVLVKMQQKVVQGQEIGMAGATGGVSEPQLHFEIRYAQSPLERAKPVDPKLVLPQG
jgi:murein DD-endopeptidase MepM/ murein hydrolase activator NlpD